MVQQQQIDWPAWPLFRDYSQGDLTSGRFDAAALLWTDCEILLAPQRNCLAVLASLRDVLERECPLNGKEQEFLDLYATLISADREPAAFDPRAYHWTRRAYDLVGACFGADLPAATRDYCRALGETDIRATLVRHLDEFKIFVRDRAHADGPAAWLADYKLVLNPHALAVPGLDFVEPALQAGLEYHRRHVPLVEQTLANIQRYAPDLFAHFRVAIRFAALKPRNWGSYDDFSHPELPGSFIASVIHNPLEMADHFIHEFQHNRLSFIEECGPLFEPSGEAESCYSPWRDKPRALYGLFHGVYVFVAVCRYWLQVFLADDVGTSDRNYVVDRLLRLPRQLTLGIGVLQRYARLTPLGRAILEQLSRDVEHLREQVGQVSLPADTPALRVAEDGTYAPEVSQTDGRPLTARQAVEQHRQLHDVLQQCAGWAEERE